MSHSPDTPRPLTRGELRRQRAREEFVADMKTTWRAERDLVRANHEDWTTAIEAGQIRKRDTVSDLPHLIAAIFTGGLWLPVWLWVFLRNRRRLRRTGPGQRSALRKRAMKTQLKADLHEQRRARRLARRTRT